MIANQNSEFTIEEDIKISYLGKVRFYYIYHPDINIKD